MSRDPAHEAVFHDWLASHRGIIFKVTLSFARSATEFGELQQEIQLQLWQSVPAFAGKSKASTWIYRVALNTAMAWRRGADRRTARTLPDSDLAQLVDQAASPADTASQREILGRLYAAIQAMADSDRALVLLLLDDLSYREIADVTGLTENHVGVALTRARQRLTTLMKGVIDELE